MAIKTVWLLRGLPGMGKTKLAKRIAHGAQDSTVIASADKYFIQPNGLYKHDATKLEEAHTACFNEFHAALLNPAIFNVVIDNVNYKRSDFDKYRRTALNLGAMWMEIVVGTLDAETSFRRNTHDVPFHVIQDFVTKWEA